MVAMKVVLVLVFAFFPAEYFAARAVTHEDIKEAMINLVHLFRDNTEKLERHEARERQLGEHLRKALSGLDSRERAQDGVLKAVAKTLSSLEERMSNLEMIAKSQEEAGKASYSVDGLPMQTWSTKVQTLINEQDSSKSKLEALETTFNNKIDYLASVLEKIQSEMTLITAHVATIESQQRARPTDTLVAPKRDWHSSVSDRLDSHSNMLFEIMKKPQSVTKDNSTLEEVVAFRNEVMEKLAEIGSKADLKLDEIVQQVNNSERTIANTIKDAFVENYIYVGDILKKVNKIDESTKSVQNFEKILLLTSDNVMDTKRRIEYGVHQISQDVKEYLTSQSTDLNHTVSHKFDGISNSIVAFQSGAVGNLSGQVEKELSQVWRQIGVMHQQITTSAAVLDKLQNETDTFITETENKMDEVTNKLDSIGSNINQIQDNHNFLMGRLSLFTHEFNETRTALGEASKYIRGAYELAQKKANQGPGPIYLDGTTEYKNVDENKV